MDKKNGVYFCHSDCTTKLIFTFALLSKTEIGSAAGEQPIRDILMFDK